ncbi:hypothetical protein RchiOBHm_Chr4g0394371 [Rosa chinensis]|uniref:Uncharacterized protein n=1 Tax=Rosa chinensis TaxID=74649 RepID=A0A2P6QRB3_ROSCH|nr:hypothetical protein RchiOBHm_Chr4g0394371 [Rosa chinensis]
MSSRTIKHFLSFWRRESLPGISSSFKFLISSLSFDIYPLQDIPDLILLRYTNPSQTIKMVCYLFVMINLFSNSCLPRSAHPNNRNNSVAMLFLHQMPNQFTYTIF